MRSPCPFSTFRRSADALPVCSLYLSDSVLVDTLPVCSLYLSDPDLADTLPVCSLYLSDSVYADTLPFFPIFFFGVILFWQIHFLCVLCA